MEGTIYRSSKTKEPFHIPHQLGVPETSNPYKDYSGGLMEQGTFVWLDNIFDLVLCVIDI